MAVGAGIVRPPELRGSRRLLRVVGDADPYSLYGNTAQFPPYGLSTAPAAAARHLRCQNAR